MILSDIDILNELEDGRLKIDPLEDIDTQIQPSSVDLRLGSEFLTFNYTNIPYIDPKDEEQTNTYTSKITIENDEIFVLHPGDFVLGTTKETVEIPAGLVAEVNGRSSLGRLGVLVHATAGVVDPGYCGEITLELSNIGRAPIALTPGMRICQILITELRTEADRPYGEERGSKYQGQKGPEGSKIGRDPDL
jgi:dCTP deaminase